ncbi:hypothetical protein L9F63_006788, partial [Diploptera punctata]
TTSLWTNFVPKHKGNKRKVYFSNKFLLIKMMFLLSQWLLIFLASINIVKARHFGIHL